MTGDMSRLDELTRAEKRSLRDLLVQATIAAAHDADPTRCAAIERLVASAPIEALPAAARLHRLSGTVWRGLLPVTGVPDEVRKELGEARQVTAMRHLMMIAALSEVTRAFRDADLSWVVMKGPVVAARLYPEVGDRTYNDLDLLVHRRDYPAAMTILEKLGYQHLIHNWALAEQMLAGQAEMARGPIHIDLHWHVHYSRQDRRADRIDPRPMLARRRLVDVSSIEIPTLDPIDTLQMLCLHAARSDGHRLLWLKDVERALAVERPDLDEVVRRCRDHDVAASVGLVLARTRTILGADVPDRIVDALLPRSLRLLDRAVCALSPPIQLHEDPTLARAFTRSVRPTLRATLTQTPGRVARRLQRRLWPPPENETDDMAEKRAYLEAVAGETSR